MDYLNMKKTVSCFCKLDLIGYAFDVIYHNWIVTCTRPLPSSSLSKDVGFDEGQLYFAFN